MKSFSWQRRETVAECAVNWSILSTSTGLAQTMVIRELNHPASQCPPPSEWLRRFVNRRSAPFGNDRTWQSGHIEREIMNRSQKTFDETVPCSDMRRNCSAVVPSTG